MPKLLLIHPISKSVSIGFSNTEGWGMPCLSLAQIAALTPDHWNIKIIDENIEEINLDEPADLVGITSYTANVTRAYELCKEYQKRNIQVVLGGIHVSMLPEEAIAYSDTIVIGEAESVWNEVIFDFENGKLKKKYYGERLPMENMVIPERKLFGNNYPMDAIQTSRGCPFDCEFCSVKSFSGSQYRQRPVDEVLNEMETIKKKIVYVIDDNFFGTGPKAKERAMNIFKGIIKRKIKKIWVTQVSMNFASDPEILKYAYKSGCRGVYVGIESINMDNLLDMNKRTNLQLKISGIEEGIRKIHAHGMAVCGSFIFGNDHDDITIFKKTLNFVNKSKLDAFDMNFLIPFPGTRLFARLKKEKRLIYKNYPEDWDKYENNNIAIIPKKMTISDLVRGVDYIVKKKLSKKSIFIQIFRTLFNTKSVPATLLAYSINKSNREIYNYNKKFENS